MKFGKCILLSFKNPNFHSFFYSAIRFIKALLPTDPTYLRIIRTLRVFFLGVRNDGFDINFRSFKFIGRMRNVWQPLAEGEAFDRYDGGKD
jgi:hypothetical protein